MYEVQSKMSLDMKLQILSDAAKYDVACTSSGSDRRGKQGYLGNAVPAGVCHSFAADGRCVSLLKILMTNHCIYDCKYCKNRKSNDIERTTFTPDEICTLTIEFYKRNYIEGLFLSSGVIVSPEYTMEKICETLRLLRTKYHFNGYIHVKAIPGAPSELLYSAGLLADRISINMELPTQDSLARLAPNKTMRTILTPMNSISETIAANRVANGKSEKMERCGINKHLVNSIFGPDKSNDFGTVLLGGNTDRSVVFNENKAKIACTGEKGTDFDDNKSVSETGLAKGSGDSIQLGLGSRLSLPATRSDAMLRRDFAPAGQSTQMIIGASGETDYELIRTTESLYRSFDLKRVFYSGYIPLNEDPMLPQIGTPVPLLREHRLYQADWLMRYYGFTSGELLSEKNPNFDSRIDPKCFWAIKHLDQFPVEINRASYDMLLRVPGIGPKGVDRIVRARRHTSINFEMLRKMGIVLKRAQYFITCNGNMLNRTPIEENFIVRCLTNMEAKSNNKIQDSFNGYTQMNLFSDFGLQSQELAASGG